MTAFLNWLQKRLKKENGTEKRKAHSDGLSAFFFPSGSSKAKERRMMKERENGKTS